MVWNKISNYFSVLKEISFLGIANIIPTAIAAGFWLYIASLVGDETYGEINIGLWQDSQKKKWNKGSYSGRSGGMGGGGMDMDF